MIKKIFNYCIYISIKFYKKISGEKLSYNIWNFKRNGGKIGKGCEIYSTVEFGSEPYLIEIGNNVRITDSVKFVTHDGGLWVLRNLYEKMNAADKFGKIIIEDNVHIGWNTIIMPGVIIGKNSVIGCGSVITKNIPANSVAVGVPAKVIESIDEYYKKNVEKIVDTKFLSPKEKKHFLLNNKILLQ